MDNLVDQQGITRGQLVDNWGNLGSVHTTPSDVHTARTAPVHKKWAANWGNDVLPRIHSPYDYDVLITE